MLYKLAQVKVDDAMIPSHSRFKDKMIADKLAKLAAKEKYTGPVPIVGVTDSQV